MTDKITLPKETEERIRARANDKEGNGEDYGAGYSAGAWIAGCAEATRAIPLLEALERIAELSTSRQDQTEAIWGVAHNAINNYNKPVE